jgi:hypothetical protein
VPRFDTVATMTYDPPGQYPPSQYPPNQDPDAAGYPALGAGYPPDAAPGGGGAYYPVGDPQAGAVTPYSSQPYSSQPGYQPTDYQPSSYDPYQQPAAYGAPQYPPPVVPVAARKTSGTRSRR